MLVRLRCFVFGCLFQHVFVVVLFFGGGGGGVFLENPDVFDVFVFTL